MPVLESAELLLDYLHQHLRGLPIADIGQPLHVAPPGMEQGGGCFRFDRADFGCLAEDGKAVVHGWLLEPGGDGLICARVRRQTPEALANGLAQLETLIEASQRSGRQPGIALLTCACPADTDPRQRPDLYLISHLARRDSCRWVAWRSPEAIGSPKVQLGLLFGLENSCQLLIEHGEEVAA